MPPQGCARAFSCNCNSYRILQIINEGRASEGGSDVAEYYGTSL